MKPRLIILIVLALVCLALAGFALRSPQAVASQTAEAVSAGGHYRLSKSDSQPNVPGLSGGRYRLLSNLPQDLAQDGLRGGIYRLTTQSAPTSSENGCCCMFLPCVRK